MFPTFTFLGKETSMYIVMSLIGALLVGFLLCRKIRHQGLNDNDAIIMLLVSAVGVLFGGHFLYGLTNITHWGILFESTSFVDFWMRVAAIWGGQVFYGGLIGGFFTGWLYISRRKLDRELYMDAMAPLIPLFHSFARVGCFLGGCCYGIESSIGFTAHGNPYVPELNDVQRFPVQLLEAFCNLILFIILNYMYNRVRGKKMHGASAFYLRLKGRLMPLYLCSYAIVRFFDEFLRGDVIRGFVFGGLLSTSQFISILLALTGIIWLSVTSRKNKTL